MVDTMTPILYDSTETEFTSNGLGRLSDAISCIIEEERNGAYELTMEYPVNGVHYKDLQNARIISAVPSDGADRQPFDIYDISRPISGRVTVRARHISYRLSRIPTYSKNPDETSGTAALALQRLKSEALESCPFDFWTDQDSTGTYSTPVPTSIRSRLGGVAGSILDCFGGEYEWDGWTVRLWKARGADTAVTLRYGKNITDLTQEESIESTVTGVIPYWHKDADSEAEAQTVVGDIVYAENANRYPYHMTTPLDCSEDYQTAPTVAQLNAKAKAYIKANNIGIPDVSITVSFVALWQAEEYKALTALERIRLCDTLRIEFPSLGVSAKAKVVKTTYNVLKDRYDSIEVGNARTNLADKITGTSRDTQIRQKQSLSFLQEALARSTKLIQGGLGGHVVINTDGDGKPNEILIMDTDDTRTATKVLRINMNGIGFSTHGYEGPFATAWTIDGVFNADYINTGTLRANLIKAGILQDQAGLNYWNLGTGEFRLSSVQSIWDWDSTLRSIHAYSDVSAGTAGKQALSSANSHADTAAANAESNAKGYAALQASAAKTEAKSYADTRAGTAESNAKSYADSQDKALNKAISDSLTQQEIFNRLTNNGATQGIYLQNGRLYINGSYIKTGTLDANLIKTGALLVGGTGKVSKVLLYTYGNEQFGSIDDSGILVKGSALPGGSPVYIDLRPDLFSGLAVSGSADRKGPVVGIAPDEIIVKDDSTALAWTLSSNATEIRKDKITITGSTAADVRVKLSATDGLHVKSNLSKSGIIDTKDYGTRALYCYEMTSPTYGDIGDGQIGDDGSVYIQLDPVFSECILTDQYQVFLQPYGDGKCHVAERHGTYFVVRGTPCLSFGWELKAKNRDYNLKRLNTFNATGPNKDKTDYGAQAVNHMEAITKERTPV